MTTDQDDPLSVDELAARSWPRIDYLVCGAGLALGVIANYVFLGLTPKLLAHHSLALEAWAGSNAAIVTGGALARIGRQHLVLVVLAPLLTVVLYDLFYWWGGRLWGNRLLRFYAENSPRTGRWMSRAEALVRRRGIWVLIVFRYLPIPNYLTIVCCGLSGMPLWAFVVGDAIGIALWEALLVSLGWAIGHRAVHIINTINHYSTYVLIAIVLIIGSAVVRARRQIAAAADPDPDQVRSPGRSRSRHLG